MNWTDRQPLLQKSLHLNKSNADRSHLDERRGRVNIGQILTQHMVQEPGKDDPMDESKAVMAH